MTTQELAYTEIEKLITNFKGMPASQHKGLNEMQIKVSRSWVDFSFRIGNVPRFFLETKRVNEDLNDPKLKSLHTMRS